MFSIVLVTVHRHRSRLDGGQSKPKRVVKTVVVTFVLVIMFGVGWIFGILGTTGFVHPGFSRTFQFAFIVVVGLQGFFFFLLQPCRSRDARNEWKKWLSCCIHQQGTVSLDRGGQHSSSTPGDSNPSFDTSIHGSTKVKKSRGKPTLKASIAKRFGYKPNHLDNLYGGAHFENPVALVNTSKRESGQQHTLEMGNGQYESTSVSAAGTTKKAYSVQAIENSIPHATASAVHGGNKPEPTPDDCHSEFNVMPRGLTQLLNVQTSCLHRDQSDSYSSFKLTMLSAPEVDDCDKLDPAEKQPLEAKPHPDEGVKLSPPQLTPARYYSIPLLPEPAACSDEVVEPVPPESSPASSPAPHSTPLPPETVPHCDETVFPKSSSKPFLFEPAPHNDKSLPLTAAPVPHPLPQEAASKPAHSEKVVKLLLHEAALHSKPMPPESTPTPRSPEAAIHSKKPLPPKKSPAPQPAQHSAKPLPLEPDKAVDKAVKSLQFPLVSAKPTQRSATLPPVAAARSDKAIDRAVKSLQPQVSAKPAPHSAKPVPPEPAPRSDKAQVSAKAAPRSLPPEPTTRSVKPLRPPKPAMLYKPFLSIPSSRPDKVVRPLLPPKPTLSKALLPPKPATLSKALLPQPTPHANKAVRPSQLVTKSALYSVETVQSTKPAVAAKPPKDAWKK